MTLWLTSCTQLTEPKQDDMAVTQSRFESVLQMRFGKPTKQKKVSKWEKSQVRFHFHSARTKSYSTCYTFCSHTIQNRHVLEFFERGRHPIKYKYVCHTH